MSQSPRHSACRVLRYLFTIDVFSLVRSVDCLQECLLLVHYLKSYVSLHCFVSKRFCASPRRFILWYRLRRVAASTRPSRKEVFQPHLPVRLPCYDLAPVTCLTLGRSFRSRTSGTPGSHGLTGGVYKARERIHRAVADARLLANPASWSRVADSNPN